MSTFIVPSAAQQPEVQLRELTYGGELLTAGNGLPVNIVAGAAGGTQYTDGGTPPANPIGNALIFDQSGTWKDVGADQPLPVTIIAALPAGTNVIGHVIADSGSTTAVTALPALPTGANTIGNVGIVAGSAVIGHVIVDTAPTTAVTGTFWQSTQPVSVASLPALPANQSTNVAQVAGTTADTNSGNKSAGTLRVVLATDQPALTNKLLVTPDSVALPANQSTNVSQVAGTAADTNSGVKSAGTLRVVLATDQPALTNKLLVTPDSVALPANQSVNSSQVAGTAVSVNNGTTDAGTQRVTLSSDSTGQVKLATGANVIGSLTANQSVNLAQYAGVAPTLDNTSIPAFSIRGKGTVAGDTALLAEILGALAGGQVSEDIVRYLTMQGKAYMVTTTKQANAATGNFPLQLLNSSVAKNFLIYSIIVSGTTTGYTATVDTITADSGWSGNTTPTIINAKLGGAASSISSVVYNTTSQTVGAASTQMITLSSASNTAQELIPGSCILLPASAANGIVVWNIPTAASTWNTTVKWLEL